MPEISFIPLAEKLSQLAAIRGKVAALRHLYLTSPRLRDEMQQALLTLAERYQDQFWLAVPSAAVAQGEYELGAVRLLQDTYPFGLRSSELLKHCGIYAMTGGGKSVAVDALLSNLLKQQMPCLVFDWDGSHRHLLSRPEGERLHYVIPGSSELPFPFNPNRVSAELSTEQQLSYLQALYYSLTERHFPNETLNREGVRFLLLRLAQQFLQRGQKAFTFEAMRSLAENPEWKLQSRENEWRTTLLNFLTRLTTGPIGQVFNSQAHLSPEILCQQQTLIDLSRLVHPIEKIDFVESLLFNLYESFLKQRPPIGPSSELRLLVVIEEIHHIEHSVLHSFFRECRKWGIGLVFTAQHPSLVHRQIRSNCYTSIAQNLAGPEDQETMGRTLLLDRRRLPYLSDEFSYLSRIPAGSGLYIVKMQGRYTRPFLLQIPPLPEIESEISLEALKERLWSNYQKWGILKADLTPSAKPSPLTPREGANEILSTRAQLFLLDVATHPFCSVTERYARLGFLAHRAKQDLLARGYLIQRSIRYNQGRAVSLQLTIKAKRWLSRKGFELKAARENPNPGREHEALKQSIVQMLKRLGHWTRLHTEHRLKPITNPADSSPFPPGAFDRVDIHADRAGRSIAFEIETGASDYAHNIQKCLAAGYTAIVVVTVTAPLKQEILNYLAQHPQLKGAVKSRVFVVHQGEVEAFIQRQTPLIL